MATTRTRSRTWTGKPANRRHEEHTGAADGTFLSDFALPDLSGNIVRVSDQTGHPYILLFVRPDCQPSLNVLRELVRLRRKPNREMLPIVIVSSDGHDATAKLAAEFELGDSVAYQERVEVLSFFRIPATPAAHEVDATRRTVGPLAIGSHEVIGLLRGKPAIGKKQRGKKTPQNDSTPRPKRSRPKLASGDAAPDFAIAVPDGYSVSLSTRLGLHTLVLFWSGICPSCDGVTQALNAIAGVDPQREILIVGREGDGPPSGLSQAPNVIFGTQDRRSVSDQYGLYQTPAAVLIDPNGRLERDPATGLSAVNALLASIQ